jgi:hypothetical protein
MNDTAREVIRQRMTELNINQAALAQLISERRNDGKKVERVTVNRALNHAGAGAPIMDEILYALGLEVIIRPKQP